jgi:8-oxo-dGTP diphosphatase
MKEHIKPSLSADVTIIQNSSILLVQRANDPYKGFWALPGGFIEPGETIEQCAIRETKEETGINVEIIGINNVYSKPGRDPRGWTITVNFICKVLSGGLKAGDDAGDAAWFPLDGVPPLAFDHADALRDALSKVNTEG